MGRGRRKRAEIGGWGTEPRVIALLVREGALVRLRRDALVDGERWRAAAPWERHELRARAVWNVVDRPGTPYALSHHSALALCGARLLPGHSRTHLRTVLELGDGRSESAGESRLRFLLWTLGLPTPLLQAEIRGEGLVARVDMLLDRERVVVELDGMLKHGAPEDLRAEKRREDALRRLGYEVVRITWADLGRLELVAARLRQAFARAATRRAG